MPYLLNMSDCTILILDSVRKAGGYKPVVLSLGQIKIAMERVSWSLFQELLIQKITLKATHWPATFLLHQPNKKMESPCILLMSFPVLSVDIAYRHWVEALNGSVLVIHGNKKAILKCTLIYILENGEGIERSI